MQQRTTDPTLARAAVLFAALAVAGGLVFALGRTASNPEGEALPDAPVQGMVNADQTVAQAPPESVATTRPVLAVADPEAEADAADPAAPSTGAPAVTVLTPTTVAVTVSSSVPDLGTEPTSTVASTSSTVEGSASTPSSTVGDSSTTTSTGVSSTSTPGGGELTDVELEIARLTNELRTNPNGPMRREGPVIDCGGDLTIDPTTGLYAPVPAVAVHTEASLLVARPWSAQMTTDLEHRPDAGIPALLAAGIQVAAAGENIAYHNFPDTAFRHFAGWRESDGHFCNLMDPGFTHLGVGEATQSDGFSYATQNFFSLPSS